MPENGEAFDGPPLPDASEVDVTVMSTNDPTTPSTLHSLYRVTSEYLNNDSTITTHTDQEEINRPYYSPGVGSEHFESSESHKNNSSAAVNDHQEVTIQSCPSDVGEVDGFVTFKSGSKASTPGGHHVIDNNSRANASDVDKPANLQAKSNTSTSGHQQANGIDDTTTKPDNSQESTSGPQFFSASASQVQDFRRLTEISAVQHCKLLSNFTKSAFSDNSDDYNRQSLLPRRRWDYPSNSYQANHGTTAPSNPS